VSTHKLSNVSIRNFEEFLKKTGCEHQRTEGGHAVWSKPELLRPVIFQTHVNPVPEFIIKNALRTLGLSKQDFFNIFFDVKN
jgi:predicted RNA binding protein YcfA (HicA-like mRNA interferase family)